LRLRELRVERLLGTKVTEDFGLVAATGRARVTEYDILRHGIIEGSEQNQSWVV